LSQLKIKNKKKKKINGGGDIFPLKCRRPGLYTFILHS
jgi:hypothetical protein